MDFIISFLNVLWPLFWLTLGSLFCIENEVLEGKEIVSETVVVVAADGDGREIVFVLEFNL